MRLAEASLVDRTALFPKVPAPGVRVCALTPHPLPAGAVTPVRMCGRPIAVGAGPSRTQILLSSAGEKASARRCRSRRMKAAKCMAS